MSTRGSFVIRKGGVGKILNIWHDAYPDGAGLDIAELIKTVDMNALFKTIVDYEGELLDGDAFDNPDFPDEPEAFTLECCKNAVRKKKFIYGTATKEKNIENDLSNEYAYVIDLDSNMLYFYRAEYHSPTEAVSSVRKTEKDYNDTENIKKVYGFFTYQLTAAFELEYVRRANAEHTAELMKKADKSDPKECIIYRVDSLKPEDEIPCDFEKQDSHNVQTDQNGGDVNEG